MSTTCACRLALTSLLGVVCTAGCPALDVSQPIALDPEPNWLPSEQRALSAAADCWNVRFGTTLQLGDQDEVWQRVSVSYDEFICISASGRTEPQGPVSVRICPYRIQFSQFSLFQVLLHELGHVLNIRWHADGAGSVMKQGPFHASRFTDEDARLFHDANPGADLRPLCEGVVLVEENGCRCTTAAPR